MNSFVRTVVTVAGLCIAPLAVGADSPTKHYTGISYFSNDTEFDLDDDSTVSASLENIMIHYGMNFMPYLSVEGRAGASVVKEDTTGIDAYSLDNGYTVSILARGSYEFKAQNVTLYGVAGISRAKNTFKQQAVVAGAIAEEKTTVFANGLSYGLGVELFGTAYTSLHVEWIRYLNTDDFKSDGYTIGLTHHFGLPKLW